VARRRRQIGGDKQQTHDAAGAKPAFGKMRRKEFEKLQVELTIACAL
jgi:hypothetical protein